MAIPLNLQGTVNQLAAMPPHVSPVYNAQAFAALDPASQKQVTAAAPHVIKLHGITGPNGFAAKANLNTPSGAAWNWALMGGTNQGFGMGGGGGGGGAPAQGATAASGGGAMVPVDQVPNLGGAPTLPNYGPGAQSYGGNFDPAVGNPSFRGYEQDNRLNPVNAIRRKPWPVHILPATVTTDANGNGTMVWTPQEDFQAFLMTFPSTITTQGYVTQITVGTRLVNIASGKMPIECFGEKNDARRIDFPFARTAQQITAQLSGCPASTLMYGVLLGYGVGSAAKYPVSAARMGVLPLGSTSLASGSTSTIQITPQERFKPRRVILNSQASLFSNLIITGFQIGTLVEQAATANYPASVYSDLAIDDWLDFDVCPKNSNIAITVNNTSTSTNAAVFEGFVIGDVWYEGEVDQAA